MVTYLPRAGWRGQNQTVMLPQLRRMRFLVFLALVTSRVARSGSFDGNGRMCAIIAARGVHRLWLMLRPIPPSSSIPRLGR
jgi:hypothetical protein